MVAINKSIAAERKAKDLGVTGVVRGSARGRSAGQRTAEVARSPWWVSTGSTDGATRARIESGEYGRELHGKCGPASSARRAGVVDPNPGLLRQLLPDHRDTIDGNRPNEPIFDDPASYGYYREGGRQA